jgi:hypothetical protein
MLVSSLQCLTQNSTYHDLALRCNEFLHYQHQPPGELRQLAEDVLFNSLVTYLVQAGMPRAAAEQFFVDPDNLTELALRISSTLGPV